MFSRTLREHSVHFVCEASCHSVGGDADRRLSRNEGDEAMKLGQSSWMVGLLGLLMMVLMGCGVEPEEGSAEEAQVAGDGSHVSVTLSDFSVSGDVRISARSELAPGDAAGLLGEMAPTEGAMETCTPPKSEWCCPFPQGCSCLGRRSCRADGTWGSCNGAGRAGQPCP
jgi:hypothetical protein